MKTNLPGVPRCRCSTVFCKDESGATAIEYGLIAALVSVVIITAVATLGDQPQATFSTIVTELGGPCAC